MADSMARIKRVVGIVEKLGIRPGVHALSPIISRTSSAVGFTPASAEPSMTTAVGFEVATKANGVEQEEEEEAEGEEDEGEMEDAEAFEEPCL